MQVRDGKDGNGLHLEKISQAREQLGLAYNGGGGGQGRLNFLLPVPCTPGSHPFPQWFLCAFSFTKNCLIWNLFSISPGSRPLGYPVSCPLPALPPPIDFPPPFLPGSCPPCPPSLYPGRLISEILWYFLFCLIGDQFLLRFEQNRQFPVFPFRIDRFSF